MSSVGYNVGTVVESKLTGQRAVIDSYDFTLDIFTITILDAISCQETTRGTTLRGEWFLPKIQPGQVYKAVVYRYKILGAELERKWRVESLPEAHPPYPGGTRHVVREFDIMWDWVLEETAKPKIVGHGNSKCPRCGFDGALVLFNVTVECINYQCVKYKALYTL